MIGRRSLAFEARGAAADAERRIRNLAHDFMELRKRVSFEVQHNPASSAEAIALTPRRPRRRSADAGLWWQRSLRPVALASPDPAPRTDAEMLPTVMVGSAIVLFKLFMLGLLIYSL